MRVSAWILVCSFASVFLADVAAAAERMVWFRDGTRIKLELGEVGCDLEGDAVSLTDLRSITFHATEPGTNLATFLELVRGLGARNFHDREAASKRLDAAMPSYAPLVRDLIVGMEDPEIRIRLEVAESRFKLGEGGVGSPAYDMVEPLEGETWFGNLGPWTATGRVADVDVLLSRSNVNRLLASDTIPATGRPAGFRVLKTMAELKALNPNVRVITFDKTAQGQALKNGDNVEHAYQAWGATLRTSIEGSFVSADSYVVQNGSGGLSAATKAPRWEGSIGTRFHHPGRPNEPAGVYRFGCYVSAVQVGSIELVAYDKDDVAIARVAAADSPVAFLGLESGTPIARVALVPDVAIDRNYAVDDIAFDPPEAYAPQPAQFGLVTRDGQFVYGDELSFAMGTWTLKDLSCGLKTWSAKEDELQLVFFNRGPKTLAALEHPTLLFNDGTSRRIHGDAKVTSYSEKALSFGNGKTMDPAVLMALIYPKTR